MMKRITLPATIGLVIFMACSALYGQTKDRIVARLFWQDDQTKSIKWGDLKRGDAWSLAGAEIASFPKLDEEQQSFVQMQTAKGVVLAGVHDTDNGDFQSGWIAIESGVTEEEHGDHSHWYFKSAPKVVVSRLDEKQGNPAHVYLYDNEFYLANDKRNGFTVVSPQGIRTNGGKAADRFFAAGGGHITLAAVGGKVAYSTWIDREGDNKGRVDVVGLSSNSNKGYSITLPSGGIHGATANSGKVFFAPSDGICWVEADMNLSRKADQVQINHLSLGQDDQGVPYRTGAFANHQNYVLFTAGKGDQSKLCVVNAKSPKPTVSALNLPTPDGMSMTTPVTLRTRTGETYAIVFQESKESDAEEKMLVIDLDPDRNGEFSDAKLSKSVTVGPSKIEGHGGHHEVSIISGGRFACVTNPGDGSIWIISMADMSLAAKLNVGGNPTRLVSVGG